LAKPTATPTANSSGIQSNSAPPAPEKTCATRSAPEKLIHGSAALSVPITSGWPRRSSRPAAGRTAIGSIRLRPMRWRTARAADPRPGAAVPPTAVVELIGFSSL